MNIFFVIKKKADEGGGLELVTAPLTRGDILSGDMTIFYSNSLFSLFSCDNIRMSLCAVLK